LKARTNGKSKIQSQRGGGHRGKKTAEGYRRGAEAAEKGNDNGHGQYKFRTLIQFEISY
jgi:hypothetical protein